MPTGAIVNSSVIWDTYSLQGQEYNSSLLDADESLIQVNSPELVKDSIFWYGPYWMLQAFARVLGGFETTFNPNPTANTSGRTRSFYDLFYNRIHYDPAVMRLGQLLNEQTRDVSVWNAFFEPRELRSVVEIDGEGLELGIDYFPQIYAPLEEKTYPLSVSVEGPPSIDATYIFEWDHAMHNYHVTGERIVVLSFAPDLSQDYVERLTWYGTITSAYSGKEQRMSLSDDPKLAYEYRVQVQDNEAQRFDSIIWGWQNRVFAVPIWPAYTYTSENLAVGSTTVYVESTELREFVVDGLAIIMADAAIYEAVEIREVHEDRLILKKPLQRRWTKRVPVLPAKAMRMQREIEYSGPVANFKEANLGLISDATEPLIKMAWQKFYRDKPVLDFSPDMVDGLQGSYTRNMLWQEGEYSLPVVIDKSGVGTPRQTWRFTFDSFEEIQRFKSLLGDLRGTIGEFWASTWTPDMTIRSPIQINGNSFYVDEAQLGNMYFDRRGRKHLAIYLRDGTVYYREIISVSVGSAEYPGTELVVIDEPIPRYVEPYMVKMISYLAICRFENESFEFVWKTRDFAHLGVTVRTLTDAL